MTRCRRTSATPSLTRPAHMYLYQELILEQDFRGCLKGMSTYLFWHSLIITIGEMIPEGPGV